MLLFLLFLLFHFCQISPLSTGLCSGNMFLSPDKLELTWLKFVFIVWLDIFEWRKNTFTPCLLKLKSHYWNMDRKAYTHNLIRFCWFCIAESIFPYSQIEITWLKYIFSLEYWIRQIELRMKKVFIFFKRCRKELARGLGRNLLSVLLLLIWLLDFVDMRV